MGLGFGNGLGRIAAQVVDVLADLVGQDIVAKSISLTQAAGSTAISLVQGAYLALNAAATHRILYDGANMRFVLSNADYLTINNASGLVTVAQGALTVSGTGTSSIASVTTAWTAPSPSLFAAAATGPIQWTSNISAANAGSTIATAMYTVFPQNALDAADWILSIGTAAAAANLFAVRYDGSIVLPTTDSSGTPGAATINQATGRSAIAAGASSCVITNSLVTAASHVFISTRTRDATGLLPLVTAIGAGSFTVSTSANCTAALTFDWLIIT